MINEEQKTMGDEEYQYPNEEYVAETSPIEEKLASPKPVNFFVRLIQSNKRITLVILIVVVALIGFKLLALRNHAKENVVKPVMTQNIVPAPSVIASQPSPQVVDQLSSLKQGEENNQVTVNQLQNQVQDLQNSLSQSTAAQAQLNESVVALMEQMKQLKQEIAAAHKSPVTKKVTSPPSAPIVFHLRAIVPGRAWIVSEDGLSESVAQGDSIPQYGTVQVVDANRGMVLTSSGKIIGYGENDH